MNVIITGASKGIGYQLAKLFSKNENNTVIGIARSEKLLKELKNDCIRQNLRNKLKTIVFDIEDPNRVKKTLIKEIQQHTDSIDILINNAGFLVNKPFLAFEIDELQKMFNVNVTSPAVLIQGLLPLLKKSKAAHVVNIASMAGFQGSSKFPGLSFYSSSKAAFASLTECLAEEFKNDHITFNALALGAVNTEMLNTAFPGFNAPLAANEMAEFIYDFAINGCKYYNGKVLPVSLSTP
ncbi:MAG: short-chain dehydrogenase [Marinilabiliales bacterium]|nr:MAG: short-chain dehydrogenase [Marinilabiliales bacterium]